MRVTVEVPDDTPEELVEEARKVLASGWPAFICIRKPAQMSGSQAATFAAACVDALIEQYGDVLPEHV